MLRVVNSIALSPAEFRAREAEHQWPSDEPIPYSEAPWGLMLEEVKRLPVPLPYWPLAGMSTALQPETYP